MIKKQFGKLLHNNIIFYSIVFGGHFPALWIFYRIGVPLELRSFNMLFLVLTLASSILGGLLLQSLLFGLLIWLAGHILWGAFLLRWFLLYPPDFITKENNL